MRIDHVIYATTDLDAAAAAVESALGVRAVDGGRHEGLGTHNRIVPLGGGYLELLAVADPEEAAASALGRSVTARLAHGEGLAGWAVAVEDVAAVAGRLGLPVTTISRAGLSARLAGVDDAMADPSLPFFIERDPGVPDPGAAGDAGGISWIEVAGDAAALRRRLGEHDLPVRVVDGPPAVRAMAVGGRELRTG